MTVTIEAALVAPGFGQCLAQRDADILDSVMRVDLQITLGFDFKVDQAMTRHLIEHVIEKRYAGGELAQSAAIQVKADADLRLQRIANNFGVSHGVKACVQSNMIPFQAEYPLLHRTLMSQYWSAVVRNLTPYVPGEQPKIANLIKLNTNENPYPPSPRVQEAIRSELGEEAARLRLYPDPNADALKACIARLFDLDPHQVFVGNGSDEVLALVFQALLKHEAPTGFPDITYSFYPVYCGLYEIDYRTIPLAEDFSLNPADYPAQCGGIIFPNPNAPTARALSRKEVEAFVAAHPECAVVVDEAYIDFGGETVIPLIKAYPNLLVVRTLSKSHGLAGLRVGYAVGDATLIEGLERVKNSFNSYPLDRLAQVGAIAALEDTAYFEQTRQAIIRTREQLVADLAALGFEVLPSTANFIFARHPRRDAAELARQLREKAIIVRHFKLPRIEQFLRISIGTDAECVALVGALKKILVET